MLYQILFLSLDIESPSARLCYVYQAINIAICVFIRRRRGKSVFSTRIKPARFIRIRVKWSLLYNPISTGPGVSSAIIFPSPLGTEGRKSLVRRTNTSDASKTMRRNENRPSVQIYRVVFRITVGRVGGSVIEKRSKFRGLLDDRLIERVEGCRLFQQEARFCNGTGRDKFSYERCPVNAIIPGDESS